MVSIYDAELRIECSIVSIYFLNELFSENWHMLYTRNLIISLKPIYPLTEAANHVLDNSANVERNQFCRIVCARLVVGWFNNLI